MFVDRVEIAFDAGHRILGHAGKCAVPHGHTYRAEVFVGARDLNELGFAIDFGDLKAPIKAWIDSNWDHAFLVNAVDDEMRNALGLVHGAKVYVLERGNPSAEILAVELHDVAHDQLHLPVESVRIWESPNQYSEYAPARDAYPQAVPNGRFVARSAT